MKTIGSLTEWQQEDLVAIIGSREASAEECQVAFQLAKKAVEKGKIVVSGLAKGIDTYAHLGALAGGGKTIAIVSISPDEKIYPYENQELAERIKRSGAIMYPFETSAKEAEKNLKKEQQPRYILRLLERDVLLAKTCPLIIAVGSKKISGGTKWAVNYGIHFGKEVSQFSGEGKQIPLEYQKAKVWWETEIKNLI